MKIVIESTQNGFILIGKFNDSDLVSKVVIEEKDEEGAELETMQELLFMIKEYFGVYYNKHDKANLTVKIEKK